MRAVILSVTVVALCACDDGLDARDAGKSDAAVQLPCLTLADEIDFGETPVGVSAERTMLLTNPSASGTIDMATEISGPPFTTSLPKQQFLGPRQSMLVEVRFNATDGRLHLGTLTFTGGVGCPTQQIPLRGLGAGNLSTETPVVDFGFAPLGVTQTRTFRLINTRRSEVRLTLQLPVGFRADGPMVVPALGSLDVPVRVTPSSTTDELNGNIRVLGSDLIVNGNPIIRDQLEIELRGRAGVPRLVVERTSIELEHLPVNNRLVRRIGIRNDGDGVTNVALSLLGGDGGSPIESIALDQEAVNPQGRVTLIMELRAPSVASFRATVLVHDDVPDGGSAIIEVSGPGENRQGCAQQLQVQPQDVSVPPQPYPTAVTFTFTNPTSSECLIDDIHGTVPGWTLGAGEGDQLIVPPMGTATRTLILGGPGMGSFEWTTLTPALSNPAQGTRVRAWP